MFVINEIIENELVPSKDHIFGFADVRICGICVAVCPIGKKRLNRIAKFVSHENGQTGYDEHTT
jgi:hypothetical protein